METQFSWLERCPMACYNPTLSRRSSGIAWYAALFAHCHRPFRSFSDKIRQHKPTVLLSVLDERPLALNDRHAGLRFELH